MLGSDKQKDDTEVSGSRIYMFTTGWLRSWDKYLEYHPLRVNQSQYRYGQYATLIEILVLPLIWSSRPCPSGCFPAS